MVDDGSRDRTPCILVRLKNGFKNLKVLNHEKNMGIGSAIKTGLLNSSGEGYSFDYIFTSQKKRYGGRSKCNAVKIFLPAVIDLFKLKDTTPGIKTTIY